MKENNTSSMALAWQEASIDLGFEFISPYRFTDTRGRRYTCSGLVVDFGGARGTLIISQYDEDSDVLDDVGDELGYYVSALSPFHYERYNRKLFAQTLIDWGWYGSIDKRPDWVPASV